ncbi:MAG: alpha/beta hydrolase [Methylococcaceae bacterium]|nr:alpha/beta hydrolase [Methylococcaceae bacterium]
MLSIKQILLTLAIFASAPALAGGAREFDETTYRYPYADPYLATTTIAIMKGREERSGDETIRDLEVALLPRRNAVPLFEGKGKLHFRLYRSKGEAPLIFIVPGLGSSAYEGSASFIAESLVAGGFHVLVMPDPLNWNFALAASRSGFPGHHVADAVDMYRAMQAALHYVTDEAGVSVGKLGLMGFSEGALCAAYVDKLDAEESELDFVTTLLINPPVDPLSAIRKIDEMARVAATLTPEQRSRVQSFAFGTGIRALKQDYDDPDYFADWDQRLRMTNAQIRYLIGASLYSSIGDTMYAVEQAQHPGVLKTPVSASFRSARLEEARSIGVLGYLERFLLPHLRIADPGLTMDALNDATSLRAIGLALAQSRRVYLMHNRDDILLNPGDIEYLMRTFGERAIVYPRGGHLGNLWYPSNKRDIVLHFQQHVGKARQSEEE